MIQLPSRGRLNEPDANTRRRWSPTRTIKSPVERRRSEARMRSELRVCVSALPVVSRRFPFLHGDETGTGFASALSFQREHQGIHAGHLRRDPRLLPPALQRHALEVINWQALSLERGQSGPGEFGRSRSARSECRQLEHAAPLIVDPIADRWVFRRRVKGVWFEIDSKREGFASLAVPHCRVLCLASQIDEWMERPLPVGARGWRQY